MCRHNNVGGIQHGVLKSRACPRRNIAHCVVLRYSRPVLESAGIVPTLVDPGHIRQGAGWFGPMPTTLWRLCPTLPTLVNLGPGSAKLVNFWRAPLDVL